MGADLIHGPWEARTPPSLPRAVYARQNGLGAALGTICALAVGVVFWAGVAALVVWL